MRDPLYRLGVQRKPALTFVGVRAIASGVGGRIAATAAGDAPGHEILVRLRYRRRARAGAQRPDER